MVQEIDKVVMIFPEYNLVEYCWIEEDVLEKPPSPYRRGIWEERIERGELSIHYTNPNPIKRIKKVDQETIGFDGAGGNYVQKKYTLLRENGAEEKLTDGDLTDKLHPLDIMFMKNFYEKRKREHSVYQKSIERHIKSRNEAI
ncbi:hypothetical protein Hanom_Chr08g00723461 [Helianthus anomalus]